jgi:parallel beta-helix repeat protein
MTRLYRNPMFWLTAFAVGATILSQPRKALSGTDSGTVQPVPSPSPQNFYVATYGDDRDSGSKARSFATLERARDAIRDLKRAGELKGPVTVWIRGGPYYRSRTFELKKEDSGTASAPIVYRAHDNEYARLVGGTPIEPSWFRPVDDPSVRDRLDKDARSKVLEVNLKAHGITDFGELGGMAGGLKLFLGDRRLPLARWPNEGWALGRRGRVTGRDKDGVPQVQDDGRKSRVMAFHCSGKRPNRWHDLSEVWLCNFFWEEYCFHSWKIERVDLGRQEMTFAHDLIDRLKEWLRFCVVNAIEEIDEPGEWFLDRKRGVLYLLPPDDFGSQPLLASILQDTMVSLDNASFITLRGLTLEAMRGLAIAVGGGSNNHIAGCTIRNASQGAILAGGTESGIVGCDIYNLEAAGVRLSGGDRRTLTPAGLYAHNTHIHDFGQCVKEWQPGVKVDGVGNRVAHCKIHHAPAYAISFEGNDHVFELNEMHDVDLEMSDVGVIGTGTDWTYRGNIIRHNFIHHIPERPYPGVVAIYMDNCASSADIIGNVLYKMRQGVLIGGGRDNRIENNIFIECGIPVQMDNRGLRWETRWAHFRPNGPMYKPLEEFKHTQPPWSTRYPKLARILDEHPQAPLGNTLQRNLSVRSGWRDPEAHCREHFKVHIDKQYMTITDNYVTTDDPGFLDFASMNFQLKDDSIVYLKIPGFTKIPFDRIGLYRDEFRTGKPARDHTTSR